MKYLDEFRDPVAARALVDNIRRISTRPWTVMEVCGGQTHAIIRNGIDQLLEGAVEFIHGPGCPVCVTPLEMIDRGLWREKKRVKEAAMHHVDQHDELAEAKNPDAGDEEEDDEEEAEEGGEGDSKGQIEEGEAVEGGDDGADAPRDIEEGAGAGDTADAEVEEGNKGGSLTGRGAQGAAADDASRSPRGGSQTDGVEDIETGSRQGSKQGSKQGSRQGSKQGSRDEGDDGSEGKDEGQDGEEPPAQVVAAAPVDELAKLGIVIKKSGDDDEEEGGLSYLEQLKAKQKAEEEENKRRQAELKARREAMVSEWLTWTCNTCGVENRLPRYCRPADSFSYVKLSAVWTPI